MTPDRASEIVAGINAFCFYHMGLIDDAEVSVKAKALNGATLAEMCQAAVMVKTHGEKRAEGGCTILQSYPHDRLIAAVYTACHYQPTTRGSIVCVPPRGRHGKTALVLVDVAKVGTREGKA